MKVRQHGLFPSRFDRDANLYAGEGHFGDEASNKPSGAATPMEGEEMPVVQGKRAKGTSKKAKTLKQKLAVADGL